MKLVVVKVQYESGAEVKYDPDYKVEVHCNGDVIRFDTDRISASAIVHMHKFQYKGFEEEERYRYDSWELDVK